MNDSRDALRIQIVKGSYRWGARFASTPDVWYVGRSPCEALGRLILGSKDAFGLLVAGFAPEGERFIPGAEPAMFGQLQAFLQEAVEAESLPPLWTVGAWGRDRYFAFHPNQKDNGPAAA